MLQRFVNFLRQYDAFDVAFAFCCVCYVTVLWRYRYLPMVDLPQWAAQLKLWALVDAGDVRAVNTYEVHFFTPYLVPLLIGRMLLPAFELFMTVKLMVTFTCLLLPLSMLLLQRQTGSDRWLSLLGFPLSVGYIFYWGFVNYLFGMPLALFLIWATLRYLSQTSKKNFLLCACLAILLFFTHVIAWAYAMAVIGVVISYRMYNERRINPRYIAPFSISITLGIIWVIASRHKALAVDPNNLIWSLSLSRLPEVISYWLGTVPTVELVAYSLVLLGILLILYNDALRSNVGSWIPFIVTAIMALFGPASLGIVTLYQRFAVFLIPTLIMGIKAVPNTSRTKFAHTIILLIAIEWAVVSMDRFQLFNEGIEDFDHAVELLPKDASVLTLPYDNYIKELPYGFYFNHFGGWVQTRTNGDIGWSFAREANQVIRFRPEAKPADLEYIVFDQSRFNWKQHSRFGYYLLRVKNESQRILFEEQSKDHVQQIYGRGRWLLYKKI